MRIKVYETTFVRKQRVFYITKKVFGKTVNVAGPFYSYEDLVNYADKNKIVIRYPRKGEIETYKYYKVLHSAADVA